MKALSTFFQHYSALVAAQEPEHLGHNNDVDNNDVDDKVIHNNVIDDNGKWQMALMTMSLMPVLIWKHGAIGGIREPVDSDVDDNVIDDNVNDENVIDDKDIDLETWSNRWDPVSFFSQSLRGSSAWIQNCHQRNCDHDNNQVAANIMMMITIKSQTSESW